MKDEEKTKEQLTEEIRELRQRLADLERRGIEYQQGIIRDIAERKRAEEALRNSEDKFRTLFEESRDAIYFTTREGEFVDFNKFALDLFGYTWEEFMKLKAQELYACPEDQSKFQQAIEERGFVRDYEVKFRKKDGTEMDCLLTSTLRQSKDGKILGYQGIIRDITERKQAEETLQRSKEYFRSITENASDVVIILDKKGTITYASPSIERFSGYKPEELIGKSGFDFIMPADLPRAIIDLSKAILTKESAIPNVFRVRHKDGSERVFDGLGKNLLDNPTVAGFVMNIRDITERKRAEEELIERERFNFALFEYNPIQTVVVDSEGKVTEFNLAKKKSGDRLPNIGDVMYKDYAGMHEIDMYAELVKCIRSGEEKEFPEQKYDNKVLSITISPFSKGAVITSQDITERKQAEEAMRESEERYRTILDNIEDGYFEVDMAGNFTFFNDSLCRELGYSQEEMMGMNNRQYMDKETAKKVYQAFNQVYATGEPYKAYDWEIIRKDGTKRIHESSVSLMRDAQGERIGFRGVTRNITEHKRIEEEREKLVGELQKALSEAKKLSGFLPICASCKKIKDDKGYWRQIEAYIRDHSEAEFSHGLCPDCMKKLYGDILEEEDISRKK